MPLALEPFFVQLCLQVTQVEECAPEAIRKFPFLQRAFFELPLIINALTAIVISCIAGLKPAARNNWILAFGSLAVAATMGAIRYLCEAFSNSDSSDDLDAIRNAHATLATVARIW
jgi:hypothetical protein